jgi:YD repeat-containing protein
MTRREVYEPATGRLVELTVDNGDGTGTRTTYDEHGNETSVEQVTGLPIPDLPADPDLIPPDTTRLRSPR